MTEYVTELVISQYVGSLVLHNRPNEQYGLFCLELCQF